MQHPAECPCDVCTCAAHPEGCSCTACGNVQQSQKDVGVTPSASQVYAEPVRKSTMFLEMTGQAFQSFAPLNAIHAHLCGIHCYHEDRSRQVIAHHYCSHIAEDVMQCLLYDKHDTRAARLIGVEYVISKRLFDGLAEDEKAYWHPHAYEVQSSLLTLPGAPAVAEDHTMKSLINTYGKTWQLWQVDRGDTLPIGPPKLMSTFAEPGQVNAELLAARDKILGISTAKLAKHRADMTHEPVDPKATA